jgi:hypothetical protein
MSVKVDALRVVQDPRYAASLSDAHWRALINDPTWNELVGEYHEMTAPVGCTGWGLSPASGSTPRTCA